MTQSPPRGLQSRGRGFFRRITASYEISDAEAELLLECCRTLDAAEDLQTRIDAAEDERARLRLLAEVRQQRLTAGRLLAQLDVPEPDKVESPTTIRARRAAESRWAGHVKRSTS
jgi:hypothetical protein